MPESERTERTGQADDIVWFTAEQSDAGERCVVCGEEAAAGLPVDEAGAAGFELELPVCGDCERRAGRTRRWAVWSAAAGMLMILPLGLLAFLWWMGVNLRPDDPGERERLHERLRVPVAAAFLMPFVAAAYLATRGRKLSGVEIASVQPEAGRVGVRFDNPQTARHIAELRTKTDAG